jgi:Protein kinase domain
MSTSADLRIGSALAGYRIEALVGRGGMGVVYLAEDMRLRRKVALKLVSPALVEDEAFRDRFLRESELAASLDHPNIVPIYEAGEAAGLVFLAMRYVEGGDLKERLSRGPLAPEEAIELLSQIADALDAAHARSLVHRDVKPSNVLIAPGAGHGGADHAYLTDFGLTRRFSEPGAVADHGQLMGTIDYVAPEQIVGEEIDGRADVYSLGCVLAECLTGEPPFRGESDLAVLYAHLEEEPLATSELSATLPEAIDAVIATALAKSPRERHETCRELVVAARSALGIATPARSRWLRAPVLLSLVGLALVAAGLASFFALRGGGQPPPPRDTLVRIDPGTNEIVESIPVGPKASSVTVGDGYLWVTSYEDRTLWRIDPKTGAARVTRVLGGTPQDVVVRNGLAVVANGPYEISYERIDASSGATIETIPLPGAEGGPASVAVGEFGIWVAACGFEGGNVARVNESTTSVLTPLERVGVFPTDPDWLFYSTADASGYNDVAVGEGGVWLARDVGPIIKRIDPETRQVVATIELPFTVKSLAAGAGGLWLTAILDDVVALIDPVTNELVLTVPVGPGADGVAVGEGSVWVVSSIAGTVTRIDPVTGEIEATIDVGPRPEDVVVGAGGVWVTTHTA